MKLINFSKSKKQRFNEFFEKTGIRLTDEPLSRYPSEIEDEMVELYVLAQRKPHKAIPRLERLLKIYPQIPALKNYLYISYTISGQYAKADAMQERILREHPDYIFGIVPKILGLKTQEELEKYSYLLGDPRDIRTIMPNEDVYHISAFTAYESAAAHYEAYTGKEANAMQRLERLIELDVEKENLNELARNIAYARIAKMAETWEEDNLYRRSVESKVKVSFVPTEETPELECQELEIFYTHSTDSIAEETIARLMLLPRETLIRDLERILEDSIRRWDYFNQSDFDNETHEFLIHALFFLGALKVEGSLQKILDLLRMGDGFTEYWFGDSADYFMFPTLYALGENQLEELKSFVLEKGLDDFNRLQASKVASQVALHQPERRAEVIKWYEDVFTYLLEHEDDNELVDTNFIGFSVADLINFRGLELLPLVKKLWDKKLIPPSICGKLETIIEDLNEPQYESNIDPLPQNIYEYYAGEYVKRKAPLPQKVRDEFEQINMKMDAPGEKLVMEHWMKVFKEQSSSQRDDDDYAEEDEEDEDFPPYIPPKQVKREAQKTGRNDPCPCGSGKKYKKCCINK